MLDAAERQSPTRRAATATAQAKSSCPTRYGKGGPPPLHPPARGSAPGNPDSMHSYAKRLMCMPTGNAELAAMIEVSAQPRHAPRARSRCWPPLQGVWGRAAPPMGSARGKARSHIPIGAVRLRGGRQGAAWPPAPPAQGCAPWNPNLMHRHAKCLARMLMDNAEQAVANGHF